jgi:hypothetical protein
MVKQLVPAMATYDPGLARAFAGNATTFKARIVNRDSALQTQLKAIDPMLVRR